MPSHRSPSGTALATRADRLGLLLLDLLRDLPVGDPAREILGAALAELAGVARRLRRTSRPGDARR